MILPDSKSVFRFQMDPHLAILWLVLKHLSSDRFNADFYIPSMLKIAAESRPQEDRFMYRLPNNQISSKPSCQMCCEMPRRRRTTNVKYFHPRWLHYGRYGLLRLRRQIITLRYTRFTLCSDSSFSTFSRCCVEHATSKPPASSIGLNHTDPIMGRKSPCQEVHQHAKPVLRLNLPADRHLSTHTLKTHTFGGAQGTTLPRRVLLLSSDLQTSTSVQINGTSDEFFSTTYFSLPECVYDL